jgi:chemotaxis protein methyltransferase CheR
LIGSQPEDLLTMQTHSENIQPSQIPPSDTVILEQIRDHIHQLSGIHYQADYLPILLDRCEIRMAARNVDCLNGYFEYLKTAPDHLGEVRELLNDVRRGYACFFDNVPQLLSIRGTILPRLLAAKNAKAPVRMWSPGCATGEDAFSLAMLLLEESETLLKDQKLEIIATDPNERNLEKCKEGIYGRNALRKMPASLQQKYFRAIGAAFRIEDAVKSAVQFQKTNLLDDSKVVFLKEMDIIFCGNSLLKLSPEDKLHALRHFHQNLKPQGYLLLGPSDTLFGETDDFKILHFAGTSAYVKKSAVI